MIRTSCIKIVFLALLFSTCKSSYKPYEVKATYHDTKGLDSNKAQDSILKPYKEKLDGLMKKFLVQSAGDFTKDGDENTLGNFMCDAMRWNLDSIRKKPSPEVIVLMNRGGMRASISKGNITTNHIFELMPFDNELELCEISGIELKKIILSILEKKHSFSGLKVIQNGKIIETRDFSGKEISDDKTYELLSSDYLVNGGDNFTFGKNKIRSEKLHILLRDAVIYYCMHLNYTGLKATPYTDGRLVISK